MSDGPKVPTDAAANHSDSEASDAPSRQSQRSSSPRGLSASPSPSSAPSASELALQDQLATLTTAHSSLTSTLRTLQVELSELKRVYQDLQEENESYEILLGEKTLNGEVRDSDLFRRSSLWSNDESFKSPDLGNQLDSVGEEQEDASDDESSEDDDEEMDVEAVLLETQGIGSPNAGAVAAGEPSGKRKRPAPRSSGGGGLDLAAELEAAQNVQEDESEKKKKPKKKRGPLEEGACRRTPVRAPDC